MDPQPAPPCEQCKQKPVGVEGHSNMFAFKLGGANMEFVCRACGSRWTRKNDGGNFTWEASGATMIAAPLPTQQRSK